jgi:hypothetical protein
MNARERVTQFPVGWVIHHPLTLHGVFEQPENEIVEGHPRVRHTGEEHSARAIECYGLRVSSHFGAKGIGETARGVDGNDEGFSFSLGQAQSQRGRGSGFADTASAHANG